MLIHSTCPFTPIPGHVISCFWLDSWIEQHWWLCIHCITVYRCVLALCEHYMHMYECVWSLTVQSLYLFFCKSWVTTCWTWFVFDDRLAHPRFRNWLFECVAYQPIRTRLMSWPVWIVVIKHNGYAMTAEAERNHRTRDSIHTTGQHEWMNDWARFLCS